MGAVTPKPWSNAIKQEVEARAPCITLDNTLNSHAHHDLFDDRFTSWNWRHSLTHNSVALDVEFKSVSYPYRCVKGRLAIYKYDVEGMIEPYENSPECRLPNKRCQIYDSNSPAPTVNQVLSGLGAGNATYGATNGPVVDPASGKVPEVGWYTLQVSTEVVSYLTHTPSNTYTFLFRIPIRHTNQNMIYLEDCGSHTTTFYNPVKRIVRSAHKKLDLMAQRKSQTFPSLPKPHLLWLDKSK